MKALSIRQPWAWLILNAGKDVENRDWPTRFRGRFLIHAAKGMTRGEYGRYGFVLRDVRPLPFTPWRGALGFFDVPDSAVPSQGDAPK